MHIALFLRLAAGQSGGTERVRVLRAPRRRARRRRGSRPSRFEAAIHPAAWLQNRSSFYP